MCDHRPERVPGARPARLPTVDTSWQGNPPQSTSIGGDIAPVDGGDVAQVRGVGPVVGEDAGDVLVVLGEPDRLGVEGVFDGEVESAVPGEQRSDPERASPVVRIVHEGSG